jgi:hypothetical protein
MERHRYIEQLITRFFGGETTNAEEQELYDFFASGDVPGSLEEYREMFAWFREGLGGEAQQAPAVIPLRPGRRYRLAWAALAAGVAGAAILLLKPTAGGEQQTHVENYIIRGGVKITDPAIVLPALEESRLFWEEVEREQRQLALQMEIGLNDGFGM